ERRREPSIQSGNQLMERTTQGRWSAGSGPRRRPPACRDANLRKRALGPGPCRHPISPVLVHLAGYRAICGTPVKPQSPTIIQVSALRPFKDLLDAEARRRVCGDVTREADVRAEA